MATGARLEGGEVKLRPIPFLKDQMVLSPTFAIDLHGRDGATFIWEMKPKALKIVGKYSTNTGMPRS